MTLLDHLARGRLRTDHYPFMGATQQQTQQLTQQVRGTNFAFEGFLIKASMMRVRDVIVFTIGGVTYEESAAVHQLNRQSSSSGSATQPLNVILGGTHVHNARSFIEQVLLFDFTKLTHFAGGAIVSHNERSTERIAAQTASHVNDSLTLVDRHSVILLYFFLAESSHHLHAVPTVHQLHQSFHSLLIESNERGCIEKRTF